MAGGEPPKQQSSHARTRMRRSHTVRKLARTVNARSPIKVLIGKSRRAKASKK